MLQWHVLFERLNNLNFLCTIKIWVYRHQNQGPSLYNRASFNDPAYKLLVSRCMKKLVYKPEGKHRVPLKVTKIPNFVMVPNTMVSKNKQVWCESTYPSFLHARAWAQTHTYTKMRTHIYIHNFMNVNFKQVFILVFH